MRKFLKFFPTKGLADIWESVLQPHRGREIARADRDIHCCLFPCRFDEIVQSTEPDPVCAFHKMLVALRALSGLIVLIHDDEASVMKTCGSIGLLSPATV
ncbi:hypothetical protein A8B83_11585 [Rhodobacteraceae bacterium EhC02]|nr:hypothetical protein A8B83_11585 [Rhodobacteraceae bacterium EhC02]